MSMLAFFPWLHLDADLSLPEFELLRFERGQKPGGSDQVAIDALLSAYVVGANVPIRKATLLGLPGHSPYG